MKYLATLPLAALLAFGAATGARAFDLPSGAMGEPAAMQPYEYEVLGGEHPHHPCHAMTSGTHQRECGSLTGGPSGGLF